jgi:hypothetical protein
MAQSDPSGLQRHTHLGSHAGQFPAAGLPSPDQKRQARAGNSRSAPK